MTFFKHILYRTINLRILSIRVTNDPLISESDSECYFNVKQPVENKKSTSKKRKSTTDDNGT